MNDRSQRASRALALVLATPGIAALYGGLIAPHRAQYSAVAMRFICFGATVLMMTKTAGVADRLTLARMVRYSVFVTLAVTIAFIWSLFRPIAWVSLPNVVVIVLGASVEEIVFRAELPYAVARALGELEARGLPYFAGVVAAQLSFAAAHLVAVGAMSSQEHLLEFLRLFGCGCFSAALFEAGGLSVAVMVHAVLNISSLSGSFGPTHYPDAETIAIGGMAGVSLVAILLVCLRGGPAD